MSSWEKESTRIFTENILEGIGLGPGVDPLISPNFNQTVNISDPDDSEMSTEDIVEELKAVVNNINPSSVDNLQNKNIINIINYIQK